MEENKIPTAKEFLENKNFRYADSQEMIEFAKLHVKAALKAAAENATLLEDGVDIKSFRYYICNDTNYYNDVEVDVNKESILSAYPESNIQ
jgi:hypothetical protein